MPLHLSSEHNALAESVAALAARHFPTTRTRDELESLAVGERSSGWRALVDSGFLSMHLPESLGGGGASVDDVAAVVEAAGKAMIPGAFVPTLLAGLALAESKGQSAEDLAPRLLDGAVAGCALAIDGLHARADSAGLHVEGVASNVWGAPGSDLLVLGAQSDAGECWFVVESTQVSIEALPGVDLTRAIGRVTVEALAVPAQRVLTGISTARVRELASTLLAAEAVGSAEWCLETALDFVRVREQFGRAVGSFQAVKHRAAQAAVRVQVIAAAARDAARSQDEDAGQRALAAATAAIVSLPGARDIALEAIALLGGIGYTWEHDIALHWRRSTASAQILGRLSTWQCKLGELASSERRRFELDVALDAEGEAFRAAVATDLAHAGGLADKDRHLFFAERGYISPHFPAPYGIGATPTQQIVLSQEFARAGIPVPRIFIAEFVLPTLLTFGTQQQQERFVASTLRGELNWCQLFSEPGAGSDLAALSTRATKVDGGWRLTGQKVWTSHAAEAHWAVCLARTDPEASKHKGITYFLLDMSAAGVEVRPLRETTGEALFNEVFLDEVFVADDCLVGEPGGGWTIATGTLATERALIASGNASGEALQALIDRVDADVDLTNDPLVRRAIGALVAENTALDALNHQALVRRLQGHAPGTEASLLKLASTEHRRAVALATLEVLGESAAVGGPETDAAVRLYLALPAVLIGGGTREIQLNVVAERVLGLPRG